MGYYITPPLKIIDRPADDKHKGGIRFGYRCVVIHATATPRNALPNPVDNALRWLTTASNPPVSIHRLIAKDGRIYKVVPDEEVAWHCGPATVGRLPRATETMNNWSLGIELDNSNSGRDPFPPEQVEACVLQVREWWGLYGALPITSHQAIQANKSDPSGYPWPLFYSLLFKRLKEVL